MSHGVRRAALLYVVNVPWYFAAHWLPLAIAAREAGYRVEIASGAGDGVRRLQAAGFNPTLLPMSRSGLALGGELAALLRLYRNRRPDLIHHITIKPVILGGLAARFAQMPAVVHTLPGLGFMFARQGLRAQLARFAVKQLYRRALRHPRSRVVFQNSDDLAEFEAAGLLGHGQGTVIRGVGVDLERYYPSPEPAGPLLVVLIARMLTDKGVYQFVEAARRLRREGIGARFALVGEPDVGNPAAIDGETLQRWHQQGDVEWWGHQDDVAAVLRQAHVLCLPTFYREGLPTVLVEAAASARPLVATDVPGCRELVRDGENGLLIPPRDADALANALRRLLEDSALRSRMGKQARALAVAEFGLTQVLAQNLSLYQELLAP